MRGQASDVIIKYGNIKNLLAGCSCPHKWFYFDVLWLDNAKLPDWDLLVQVTKNSTMQILSIVYKPV